MRLVFTQTYQTILFDASRICLGQSNSSSGWVNTTNQVVKEPWEKHIYSHPNTELLNILNPNGLLSLMSMMGTQYLKASLGDQEPA